MAWPQLGTSALLVQPALATFLAQATPWSPATAGEERGQRSFRFSLAYRFGQQAAGRERKAIENDDTKSSSKGEG